MEVDHASQTMMPDTIHTSIPSPHAGFMSKTFENFGVGGILLSLLVMAIAYDQSEY